MFILLAAFHNDCWSGRFFVKPSHSFSKYSLFFSLFFSFWVKTLAFCSCCYISNPIPTTLGSSQKSQQSFHTLFGLPIFTIEPWSPLLYSLLSEKCFVFWLSSVSKRDTNMSSASFRSRAVCSVASSRVFVKTLDLTLFWHAHVKLSCQMSFVTTVTWSPAAQAPCWRAVFRQLA